MKTLKYIFYVLVFSFLALSPVFLALSFVVFGGSIYQLIMVGRDYQVVFILFGSGISTAIFGVITYHVYSSFFLKNKSQISHQ